MNDKKHFRLHWRDGKIDDIYGPDITTAINCAGYGAGAMPALDYWEEIKEDKKQDE